MSKNRKVDWFAFWMHFILGALFGALLGFAFWGKSSYASSPSLVPGAVFVGGGSLLLGLIAGCTRDQFWEGFRNIPRR